MGGSSTDYSSSANYDFSSSSKVTGRSASDYAKADRREYSAPHQGLASILGKDISTNSRLALAAILDQTGSMREIPRLFIQKISTFYAEANAAIQGKDPAELAKGNNLKDLLDMAVVAIGDSRNGESYPFQVLPYCHGADLVKGVLGIFPEGNGGGNLHESYDLGAYYLLNHSETPKIIGENKPILIVVGDESFYDTIRKDEVKRFIGDDLTKNLKTEDVMNALKEKFDTYILRPEVGSYSRSQYDSVQSQWESVFGPQRVMKMKNYERLVDCMIGICGYAADNFKVSEDLLRRRQTPAQVEEVLAVMHPLFAKNPERAVRNKKK